jgi:hypothetical protein
VKCPDRARRLQIPDAAIADLRERLARPRFPEQAAGPAWAYGTDVAYLRRVVKYWRMGFDWRAQEAGLNALRQYRTALFDMCRVAARHPVHCSCCTVGRDSSSSSWTSFPD